MDKKQKKRKESINSIIKDNIKNIDRQGSITDTKGKKKNKIIIYIVLALVVLYICYAIFLLTTEQSKNFTVEKGKIYIEESNTGYIIRDETVVKGENYKNGMEQIKTEGEKVSVNESVFRYYSQNEGDLKQKIAELDGKIQEAMKQTENIATTFDVKTIENQIDDKVLNLSALTDNSKIAEFKKEISELVSKKARMIGEASPQGSFIKDLIEERAGYENELNSGAEYIRAPKSGLVSYRVDGLEETLTPNNIESLSEEYLNNLNIKTSKIVATNEECGKIIDNFKCYIATISKSEQAKEAKVGDKIKIRISLNTEVDAKITNIKQESDDSFLIVLEVRNGIQELVNYRKISLSLIWLSYSGFKVPNQAIAEKDGLKYVVRKRAGYLTKVLIKIATRNDKEATNEKYSIIENYKTDELEKMGYSNKEINSYRGIALFDEIVLNPDLDKAN
ncbi:MAG: hypothetical protein IJH76_03480 [Clostridia bacterium]|nr:hypothetical protein [Clostridia bacterium]